MAVTTSILKYLLKTNIVKSILYDIVSNISRYYYAFGRPNSWGTNDEPTEAIDSYTYELETKNNILLYKYIDSNDASIVVPRRSWAAGTTYDMYDEYSESSPAYSGANSLDQANFYVLTDEFNVYKCLYNNENAVSTVMPTGTSQVSFTSSDGYKWKYIYSIPLALRNKFLTGSYMPVVTSLTNQFYSRGSVTNYNIVSKGKNYPQTKYKVSKIIVLDPGTGYTSITLTFPAPPSGTTATASAVLSGGTVTNISVTAQGSGYSYPPDMTVTSVGGSGLRFEIVYERDTALGEYTEIQVIGDGYNSENPYSLKKITITNKGEFTTSYSGNNVLTFPAPSLEGRKAEVQVTSKAKTIMSGTWTAAGTSTVTVTKAGHGLTAGSYLLDFTASSGANATDGTYSITVVDTNTFTITNSGGSITGSGTVTVAFYSGNWTTTASSTITITRTSHGLSTGDVRTLTFTSSSGTNATSGTYSVTVTGLNTFQITNSAGSITGAGTVLVSPARYEIDTITISDTGYGYTVPLVYASNVTSILSTASETVLVPLQLSLNESGQKNEATLIPVINASGEIEAVRVVNGGEGYTYITLNVNYVIEDTPTGQILASTDPASATYRSTWEPATVITTFDVGDIVNKQSNVELFAVDGSIEVIAVDDPGANYSSTRTVAVTGDGTGCTAELVLGENGIIEKVNVTNVGYGYTKATVTIGGAGGGTGASLRAIISPKGGHGKDAISELFAKTIAFSSKLSGDKNQGMKSANAYRQVSIVKNPRIYGEQNLFKNAAGSACLLGICDKDATNTISYDQLALNDILLSQSKQFRLVDKQILLNKYYLLLQPLDGYVPVTSGSFSKTVGATAYSIAASSITAPSVDKFSGEMIYLDNRNSFQPSETQAVALLTLITF